MNGGFPPILWNLAEWNRVTYVILWVPGGYPQPRRYTNFMTRELTKTDINGAVVDPTRTTWLWDGKVSGFGCKVTPNGVRSFVLQYRLGSGRTATKVRETIGRHGSPWTVVTARKEALRRLGIVAGGGDPGSERKAARSAMTVGALCDLYLERAALGEIRTRRGPKKASTLATDAGRILRHIKPLLGKRPVRDLDAADIVRFHAAVARGDTAALVRTKARGLARVTGGEGTAARTVGLLQGILSFAMREGIRHDNPAFGIELPAAGRRIRYLDAGEYAALGKALEAAMKAKGNPWALAAIRYLAVTGARKGEALSLQWTDIDRTRRTVTYRDTKTGTSIRPLPRAAIDAIADLPRMAKNPYVFAASRGEGQHLTGLAKSMGGICKAAGIADATAHTLRHSLATHASDLGISEPVIAALLGHSRHSVTSRYTHVIDTTLIAASDKAADAIAGMMGEAMPAAQVVQLHA
jgi:integrase